MKKLFVAVLVLIILTAFEQDAKTKLAHKTMSDQPNTTKAVLGLDSLLIKIQLINKSKRHEK